MEDAKQGWITGYPDGTFKADQPITRAEIVVVINRVLDRKPQNVGDQQKWSDVTQQFWAYPDIMEASVDH